MASKKINRILNVTRGNPTNVPQATPLGSPGYDNARDDIEKVKKLREGSVVRTPTENYDIANKAYIDAQIASIDFWQRVGTALSPKTAEDDIETTGDIEGTNLTALTKFNISGFEITDGLIQNTLGSAEIKDSVGRKFIIGVQGMTLNTALTINQATFQGVDLYVMAGTNRTTMEIEARSGQTADLLAFTSNGGTQGDLVTVDINGNITTTGTAALGTTTITGIINVMDGDDNVIVGHSNTVDAEVCSVFGSGNIVDDEENIVLGVNCEVDSSGALAVGYQCDCFGDSTTAVGHQCIANGADASAFGYKVNNTTAGTLEIGASNAGKMSMDAAGNIIVAGNITTTGTVTAGASTFGDGGTTNYTEIKADGKINLHGTARVKRDTWVPADALRAGGTSPANFTIIGLSGAWRFADNAEDEIIANIKFPNDMDMSVAPTFSIGWSTNDTNQNDVEFKLEYLYTKAGDDTSAAAQDTDTSTDTAVAQADGLNLMTKTLDVPEATDVCLHLRLTRLAKAGSNDTIADNVDLHGICLGYTSDKLGEAT